MKKLLFSVTILIILFATSALAANRNFNTGLGLLHRCESALNGTERYLQNLKPTLNQEFDIVDCYAYIRGIMDGYTSTIFYVIFPDKIKDKEIIKRMLCLPDNITTEQATRIIVKDLKNHPKELNLPSNLLIYNSLQEAFPCPIK